MKLTRRRLVQFVALGVISANILSAATITSSIGSAGGRDYSTIQAWHDALPSDVVASGNSYVGECYNDSEFAVAGSVLVIGAFTTDASHTITLTAASGQSFQDNASVRSNALKYNVSNGVGLNQTGGISGAVISMTGGNTPFFTISRLQITNTSGLTTGCYLATSGDISLLKDLICESDAAATAGITIAGATCVNCLSITLNASGRGFDSGSNNSVFIACTGVSPSDVTSSGHGFGKGYGTPIVTDCASFGFSTGFTAGFSGSSSNNATDAASAPGTSNQTSVTYNSTTPFVSAAASTRDFRSIASTALDGNGVLDSTNAPNDISGLTRPSGPTIGVWQLATAATYVSNHSVIVVGP